MTKKIFSITGTVLALFLTLSLSAKAKTLDEQVMSLVIEAKDGTKVAYALRDKPRLTFTDTQLIVKTADVEVAYDRANLLRFTYEPQVVSGIEELTANDVQRGLPFRFDGDALVFGNLKAGSSVRLTTPNGIQVLQRQVTHDGQYALPLSQLSRGVYLVSVNGITHKIVKP